jgi:hypothetical protein
VGSLATSPESEIEEILKKKFNLKIKLPVVHSKVSSLQPSQIQQIS